MELVNFKQEIIEKLDMMECKIEYLESEIQDDDKLSTHTIGLCREGYGYTRKLIEALSFEIAHIMKYADIMETVLDNLDKIANMLNELEILIKEKGRREA